MIQLCHVSNSEFYTIYLSNFIIVFTVFINTLWGHIKG